MGYENIDEVARQEACERLKKIVKAIKAIKIKYHLIFSKISTKDRETYQKLENELEQISEEHNLNNLKVALMQEINARYNGESPEDMKQGNKIQPEDILQACYGAVDAQKEALSKGRISQALRCQEQLKKYMDELDEKGKKEIINYKREKFAELMQSREQVEEQIKSWNNTLKGMYKVKHVGKRKEMYNMIQNIQNKENAVLLDDEMEKTNI